MTSCPSDSSTALGGEKILRLIVHQQDLDRLQTGVCAALDPESWLRHGFHHTAVRAPAAFCRRSCTQTRMSEKS